MQSAQASDGQRGDPGTEFSWGSNREGQLGDDATIDYSRTPVRVCGASPCSSPLDRVVAVAAGDRHTTALRADGTVWTWGANFHGELGDGTKVQRSAPVQVCAVGQTAPCNSFLSGVIAVAAGDGHNLAVRADGTVVAWGLNAVGQLGDGTSDNERLTPVQVCAPDQSDCAANPLTGVTAIAAGGSHSLALQSNSRALGWGYNTFGQVGDGTQIPRSTPVGVLSRVTDIAAGDLHSLAVLSDGTARSWGDNIFGQLGDGTTDRRLRPVPVCAVGQTSCATNPLTGVTAIAAGNEHSLAVLSDRTARSWGSNDAGQLGDGTTDRRLTPVPVCAVGQTSCAANPLTGVTAIAASAGDAGTGLGHSLAVVNGTVHSWGANLSGQLGDGSTVGQRNTPVKACASGLTAPCRYSLSGVTAIAAGDQYSLALTRPTADLALALSGVPDSVVSGANLTYTVTVTNHGPTDAENVQFNNTLPPDARFVSASSGQGSCKVPPVGSSDTVTCSLGSLEGGAQATAQIVVRVVAARGGVVTDSAKVSSTTPDPNEVNNTATIVTPVR
ncbi:hypothetical protein [Streptomyces sp. R44]|uniref:DUF11 domain-containing protein n=1 Tax=Streptomyces sp. R44 TaxID=3238633 RepID=A0AB39TAC9_9ACTN